MSFIFVPQEDCKAAQQEIDGFGELKAVPGTMKIHAVASLPDQPGQIVVRETSCYCERCFTLDSVSVDSPCKWQRHHLTEYQPPESDEVKPSTDDWVAADYDGKWYIGKVLKVDLQDRDAYITFMQASEKCEDTFKLPSKPGEVWINFTPILAIIAAPSPYGKTKRQYEVNTETMEMISRLHTTWLEKNTSNE